MQADQFTVGDIVKVTTRDPKENKVHATPFEGVVISYRGETGSKTFTVRKQSTAGTGIYIEKIFPLDSPAIEKIQVIKKNQVRKAKLYYLRKKSVKGKY